jgi:putative transposase
MKTFKFKLYHHKRNRFLKRSVNASGVIYNHCIALHKRYYRMYGKHLNVYRLQKHIAKLRKRKPFWQLVGSQAVQDICQRIEKGYQLFFKHHSKGVRPPTFKKVKKYKSFTLKQAGYRFLDSGKIKIAGKVFKFWNSQEIEGRIKTVTVKRTSVGEIFIYVVTDAVDEHQQPMTGRIAGLDFGLKTFLSLSDGSSIESPLFLKQSLTAVKKASRQHSRKVKGSHGKEKARKALARLHEDVSNRRSDWFWKLAHQLTDTYDYLFFEALNLKGMQRLWGRKVTDLAFSSFLDIVEHVAHKKGKHVGYIDQWYPSSKTCSHCEHKLDELPLDVRQWRCPSCKRVNDRDVNAAKNIERVGVSTLGLGNVRQVQPAIAA